MLTTNANEIKRWSPGVKTVRSTVETLYPLRRALTF
jgi:hypothetical protein